MSKTEKVQGNVRKVMGPEWSGRGGYVRVRNVRFTKARVRKGSA